mmetsp:Transcript_122914/g.183883  ORF Transcript_122914/g.183883 Transcript_122914/m.183883 type:complete len:81 (-) Transcript_122914:76-318(-)
MEESSRLNKWSLFLNVVKKVPDVIGALAMVLFRFFDIPYLKILVKPIVDMIISVVVAVMDFRRMVKTTRKNDCLESLFTI